MKTRNFDPTRQARDVNMYGFTSCPKCGKHQRYSLIAEPKTVRCDDCGFLEPLVQIEDVLT
jgi:hypothetical protein